MGVVGPIGSGKSSLLDGVAFALYGKTPTFERNTRDLINQRTDAAHVELWFEVDGQPWRAVRVLRRGSGQAGHSLYRHAAADPASEVVEEVLGAAPATARVEELLGLDFAAFRRSILLAQNQFAGFLRAGPAERDAVLKGVFGFEKVEAMQAVAKARRDAARHELADLERRRREIEEDRLRLEEARAAAKEATERAVLFDDAAGLVAAADEAITASRAEEDAAGERRAELEGLAARLPDRRAAEALVASARAAGERVAATDGELAAAREALAAAEQSLAATLQAVGGRQALDAARLAVARLADRREAVARLSRLGTAAAQAEHEDAAAAERAAAAEAAAAAQLAAAEERLAAAEDARREAAQALHEARHADAAAELRTSLSKGAPCPVCGQDVAVLPKAARRPGLAAKEKAVAKAERDEAKAADGVKAAATAAAEAGSSRAVAEERVAAARQALTSRREELAAAEAALQGAADQVAALLGAGDPDDLLAGAEVAVTEAEQALELARQAEQAAVAAAAAARQEGEDAAAGLRELATEVAGLAGRLGAEVEVPAEPDGLSTALDEVRQAWSAAAAAADETAAAARAARAEVEEQRTGLLARLGLAAGADFAVTHRVAAAAAAAAARDVELLEERVARFAELERDNAAAVTRLQTFERLADDLAPSKFLKYLLEEERRALADLGSDRFELLSGGRYRFTPDDTFRIVDLAAAEAERRPESLSGGETFLASLALALALAEMVTRSGGRLDAFFLDEGFGSLDREHLDLAMEGIERLVADSPDRLVVLVSHVAEMRHRMEDLVELDRDPVTGATRVIRS